MECIKWINEQYPFILSFINVFRLMVSASQDGKLLIWDSHSGNKVRLTQIHFQEKIESHIQIYFKL